LWTIKAVLITFNCHACIKLKPVLLILQIFFKDHASFKVSSKQLLIKLVKVILDENTEHWLSGKKLIDN